MSILKELYFQEYMRRKAAGEKMPETETSPWTDHDPHQLLQLRQQWALGRRLASVIGEYRAAGRPLDDLPDLLGDVKRLCDGQLQAWQPKRQQRARGN